MKSKIILVKFSGGFHNSPEIKMKIDWRYLETSDSRFLSDFQVKKLKRHFCGSRYCKCPSYKSASVSYPSHIVILREY